MNPHVCEHIAKVGRGPYSHLVAQKYVALTKRVVIVSE